MAQRDADFAEAAWTWLEQHRGLVDRAIDGVIRSRRWKEAVSRGEAFSECAYRLPALLRTYKPTNAAGASLETHVEVGLRHWLHKLCVRTVYGVNPSVRIEQRVNHPAVIVEQLCDEHADSCVHRLVADDTSMSKHALVQEMLEAVDKVHPLYRWLLERRYTDGMSLDVIAALLEKHKSTARRYMKGAEDAARCWAADRGRDNDLLS